MTTLANQGLVLENDLVIRRVTNHRNLVHVTIDGRVLCCDNVTIKVSKTLDARRGRRGQILVRGRLYSYHAYLNPKPERDLLRICTAHNGIKGLHKHDFHPHTGAEVSNVGIELEDLPTLGSFIELAVELGRERG